MRCKPRTIHNAQLPKDSTFPGLFSCSKKILPTRAGMYLWDHRSNDIWGKGIIKAPRGSVLNEVIDDSQNWWRRRNHLRPSYEVIPSKLETGPQNVILDFFGLLTLGNNGTQEIQPSNQRSLSLRCPREPSVSLAIWETSKASIRSKLKLFGQNISFYW
ncbi:unnamed protein product [Hymenolepis diminuta]|uniref:Uncharacterized protein n=1 Tax=Hymenolepis diminuta TaxID=6216 RepID=A0A0R3SDE6_HYMDI|nr:unnamed protein product [Hymenolepis diminuta]